ncbi:MAG: hypothetical protein P9M05_01100 [Candidatus Stygibacter australis]|nr:hypothetical protein [Candidatus Stygibacter australis]
MKSKIPIILLLLVLSGTLFPENSLKINDIEFSPFIHFESRLTNDIEFTTGPDFFYQNKICTTDVSAIGCNIRKANFFSTANLVSASHNSNSLPFYFDINLGYSLYKYSLYCGKIYNLNSDENETMETLYLGIDKDIKMNNLLFRLTAQYINGDYQTATGATEYEKDTNKFDIISLNLFLSYDFKYFFPYGLFSGSLWNIADDPQYQLSLGISLFNPPAARNLIHPAYGTLDYVHVDKPNIYLYPEQECVVDVHIEPNGKITKSIPEYGNGWNVTVTPEGLIDDQYNFLFYEAKVDVNTPPEGWFVAKADLQIFFSKLLTEYNLNEIEIKDFIEYWTERLTDSQYYTVHPLLNDDIDPVCPISIDPKPDNLLRLWFVFIPQNEDVKLPAPVVSAFQRNGFYVVEWGGILHN